MKKVSFFVITYFLFFSSNAQNAFLQWAKHEGGEGIDNGNSIDVDPLGNIYLCGDIHDTSDMDPGPGTQSVIAKDLADVFIQKLDASGNLLWVKSFGSNGTERGSCVKVDAAGNIYAIGYFDSTIDFNPGAGTFNLVSAGNADIFILKLDPNGNFVWAKRIGGADEDMGYALALDASGNIYATGCFRDTVDFDPGAGVQKLITAGTWDIFVLKLDASGNFVWAKQMGSPNFDIGRAITVDGPGNVYSTGYFTGTVDFNPSPSVNYNLTSAGMNDVYVQKLDNNGNFIWAVQYGGVMSDYGQGIVTDATGNVYTAGYFSSSLDADPGAGSHILASIGASDIFIQKLDASGNFVWAKQIGSPGIEKAYGIAVDLSNNVYTTGSFSNTADFDPNGGTYNLAAVSNTIGDGFVQKLDAAGNFQWAQRFGGGGLDEGGAVQLNAVNNVYVTGSFTDTASFTFNTGPRTLISSGGNDVFIEKIMQCTLDSGTITPATACKSYTWIDGNTYTASDTIAFYVARTGMCDSVFFLDLTILPAPDKTVAQSGNVLTSNATGASYQWVDCNSGFSPVSGATSQSYAATASGSYAVVVTDNINGCKDTSLCTGITITGLDENTFERTVRLYPDPTTGTATLDLGGQYSDIALQIVTITGRIMHNERSKQASEMKMDLGTYPAGVYFIRIHADGKHTVLRLVKQ